MWDLETIKRLNEKEVSAAGKRCKRWYHHSRPSPSLLIRMERRRLRKTRRMDAISSVILIGWVGVICFLAAAYIIHS